jgi:predicted Ser/Thr protein kinase
LGDSRHGQHPSDTLFPRQFPPLGKFTLVREIGRGAMGVVYEGIDTSTDRTVAIKLLNSPPVLDPRESKPSEDRFLREARLAATIPAHPGIVGILGAGILEGRRYIAMEFVRGVPLSEWRKQASLTVQKHVGLIRDIALAAHHAHEHGVVHRDLKPENVLIDRDLRPRLTDFGLAKGADDGPALTATGMAVGTPYYMSPEQVQGRKDVDRRTDVYALGVLLYEVLAGRRPFTGDSSFEIMTRAVNEPVVPPSRFSRVQINPVLFKNLETICLIALSKDREDRYPTAQAFAEDLAKWLRGEDFKVVVPRAWRVLRTKQAMRRAAVAAVVVLLALAATMFFRESKRRAGIPAVPPRAGAIAEYYSGTNFNALGLRRIDARPAFESGGQPLWPEGPRYWVSLRWTGLLDVPRSATYVFQTLSKEGVRLRIDGATVITNWGFHPPSTDTGTVALQKGRHPIALEYYHTTEQEVLQLSWKAEGDAAWTPLGPATFLHDPASFEPREPSSPRESGPVAVAGAQEGENLTVLEATGARPISKLYDSHQQFWRGRWSGTSQLWWGREVKPGDRLRLQFESGEAGARTLVLALTRASDHGIFKVSVNGVTIAPALDLYDADLLTGEIEFRGVDLRRGANELEFLIVGSNALAREWGPGSGLHKMALDYVLVK